jgi:hypothetical protein
MTNERYPDRGFRDDGPLEDRDTDRPHRYWTTPPEIAAIIGEAMGIGYGEWDDTVWLNPPWEPEAIRTWIARAIAFIDRKRIDPADAGRHDGG